MPLNSVSLLLYSYPKLSYKGHIDFGIAAVIKAFVRDELRKGLLYEIPVTPAIPPREIGVVTPEGLPLSIAAETFIDAICEGYMHR